MCDASALPGHPEQPKKIAVQSKHRFGDATTKTSKKTIIPRDCRIPATQNEGPKNAKHTEVEGFCGAQHAARVSDASAATGPESTPSPEGFVRG